MQIRKDISSKMYHYTSLESLCSIVENQEFWLGDTRQMNDYNEALERLNILNSLLNEDADLRDDPQCRDVILSINRNTLLKTPIYVACFTKLADDAAQWERYANNAAGVAIEFDVAKFERAMQFNSQMLRCITYIQGDVVKEEIAHSDMYRQAKEYILSDNKGKNPFYAITVASYALWFKNKGFEQENEIRFMLPSFFDGHGFDMEDLGKCEYVRNSIVKSYYKLNLQAAAACAAKKKNAETFWSAISSITLGPRSKQNPDIFKGYLQDVLGKNGFSGVHIAVKPSACSLR